MMSLFIKNKVRVRIAPSPTGNLHIGTARTALFNWLFARSKKGKFIVRIEDTDKERSKADFELDILSGLRWLGLDFDEGPEEKGERGSFGPYRQSRRGAVYRRYLEKLLKENRAYYCFCSKEELESIRQSETSAGKPPVYSGRCRSVPEQEVKNRLSKGERAVIRLKMPIGKKSFKDIVRKVITFDTALIGDIVIAKSLDSALYNFSVVVDDHEMKISHVIRGEDHIGNTPKQVAIIEALGFKTPQYAHLPLILNMDRSKMSKRFNATAISEYRREGYLPEAILNFLLLLGWHPEGDKEIYSIKEMIKAFSLERVQKGGAVFNRNKLDWFNSYYLKQADDRRIFDLLKELGQISAKMEEDREKTLKVISRLKERMKRLTDFSQMAEFFFELPAFDPKMLVWKNSTFEKTRSCLEKALEELKKTPKGAFTEKKLESALFPLAEKEGKGEFLWPLRVSLSGSQSSPGPFEIMEVLGKDESVSRIESSLDKLSFQPKLY